MDARRRPCDSADGRCSRFGSRSTANQKSGRPSTSWIAPRWTRSGPGDGGRKQPPERLPRAFGRHRAPPRTRDGGLPSRSIAPQSRSRARCTRRGCCGAAPFLQRRQSRLGGTGRGDPAPRAAGCRADRPHRVRRFGCRVRLPSPGSVAQVVDLLRAQRGFEPEAEGAPAHRSVLARIRPRTRVATVPRLQAGERGRRSRWRC